MPLFRVFARIAVSLSLVYLPGAVAAPGDLDLAFGVNGISSFSMGRAAHTPTGFITQPGGKYFVSFGATVANGGGALGGTPPGSVPFGGGVARFNSDHTLDTSWGHQGVAGLGMTVSGIALSNGQLLTIENGAVPYSIPSEYSGSEFPLVARYSANGNLDASFGNGNGHTSTVLTGHFAGPQQRFNAIAVAPDGKIVVVGSDEGVPLVTRFNTNGTQDYAFGSGGGWVRFWVGQDASGTPHAVAIQADGRIVITGSYGLTPRAFIARLTANGALDPDFGVGGIFSFSSPADPSECRSVAIDGTRIVAGCTTSITGGSDMFVLGLTSAGVVDPTFGNTLIDLGGAQDKLFALFKHPDGRFIATGRGGANGLQPAVVAVDASGARVSGFGTNGVYLAPETDAGDGGAIGWNGSEIVAVSRRTLAVNDDAVIAALSTTGVRNSVNTSALSFSYGQYVRPKILPDGRILAIGNISYSGQGAFRVSRFLADGSLDTTFNGVGHTSFFTDDDWIWGVREFVLQPDGNMVVTGGFGTTVTATQTLGVARVLGSGGLDPAFNPGANSGVSSFTLPNTVNASAGRSVRLQSDGKILLAARYVPSDSSGRQMMAVRFNADGSRDMGYGVGGLAKSAFLTGATNIRAMDLDNGGQPVLFGDGAGQVRLTRFTTGGVPDTSFGSGGMASFPLPAGYSLLYTAAAGFVLPNGKIIAVLNANKGIDGLVGLMRANANGTLDTTFGNGGFSFVMVSPGKENDGNTFHAAISPNGRIVLVGYGSLGNALNLPGLVRFMPDGKPDASFGDGGIRFYSLPPNSWLIGAAFAADGAMILTGGAGGGGRVFGHVIKTVADGNAVGPNLVNAVSRKLHAGHGSPLDLTLDTVADVAGLVATEPRAHGTGHTIVFRFDTTITSVSSAVVVDANGTSLGQVTPVFSGTEVSVPLPPMANMTRAKVSVSGVNGLTSAEVSVGFLFGDVARSRKINAVDISAMKSRTGQSITLGENATFDVDVNGSIDSADLSIVKARSGMVLP